MKPSLESAIGYSIGCALVGALALVAIGVIVLLALAFPVTLTIVVATLAALAFLRWRKDR